MSKLPKDQSYSIEKHEDTDELENEELELLERKDLRLRYLHKWTFLRRLVRKRALYEIIN